MSDEAEDGVEQESDYSYDANNRSKTAWKKPKEDVANKDAFVGAGGYSLPQKVNVTYTVVFENEGQLKGYQHYLRLLKKKYPDVRTIGARLTKHLEEEIIPPMEAAYGKAAKKSSKDWPAGHAPYDDVKIVKEGEDE